MKNVIRVAYFEPDNSALIAGPLRQIVEQLSSDTRVSQVFIAPHWKLGPHVDLVIDCDSETFDHDIYPASESTLLAWLEENPSTQKLDPISYQRTSQQLALVEIEPGPYLPLLENNSISKAKFIQNSTLKLNEFGELKSRFLAATLPLVFRLQSLKQHRKSDFFVALSILLAGAGTFYRNHGLGRGFNSFRSHAEFFMVHYDNDGRIRTHFDNVANKYKASLDVSIAAILSGDFGNVSDDPELQSLFSEWMPIAADCYQRIENIVATNHDFLVGENIFQDNLKVIAADIPDELHYGEKKGPMAIALENDEGLKLLQSPEFMSYRTLINFFYFLLPALNVSPAEKYCICNMTAATVEGLLDITWQDIMIPGYTESRKEATA